MDHRSIFVAPRLSPVSCVLGGLLASCSRRSSLNDDPRGFETVSSYSLPNLPSRLNCHSCFLGETSHGCEPFLLKRTWTGPVTNRTKTPVDDQNALIDFSFHHDPPEHSFCVSDSRFHQEDCGRTTSSHISHLVEFEVFVAKITGRSSSVSDVSHTHTRIHLALHDRNQAKQRRDGCTDRS